MSHQHSQPPLLPRRGRAVSPDGDNLSLINLLYRVNEQPGLATIHTLWLREHNRVALSLANLNPHWSDDRVFLETRSENIHSKQDNGALLLSQVVLLAKL